MSEISSPTWSSSSYDVEEWLCSECLVAAVSSEKLFIDLVLEEDPILFDDDDTPWLFCHLCRKDFHVRCVPFYTVERFIFGSHMHCTSPHCLKVPLPIN